MEIKPIQTEYKGYKFRSRLEARWAVFFDACGLSWEYEPEGYDLGDGLYYLPDFLLHGYMFRYGLEGDLYVEVKGCMSSEDRKKINYFSWGNEDHILNPILVVGSIPDGRDAWDMADQAFSKWNEDGAFYSFENIDGDYYGCFPGINEEGRFELFGADSTYLNEMDRKKTENAYKLARQARFEHGECPVIAEKRQLVHGTY